MSTATVQLQPPRLFPLEERSLEDAVLTVLAQADHAACLICGAPVHAVPHGVACDECGAELVIEAESGWAT